MVHNADMGRGVIGVVDVTDIMVNLARSLCYTILLQITLTEFLLTGIHF